MTGTIDITCTVPAPTLAQVRAWLTHTGWTVNAGPLGPVRNAERWSHPKHGSAWMPREELEDWLTYVSCWLADRAWQIDATPESVYREIMSEAAPRLYVAMEFIDAEGQFDDMHIAHLMESGSMKCEVMGSGKTEQEARDDLAVTAARFHTSLGTWLAARGESQ